MWTRQKKCVCTVVGGTGSLMSKLKHEKKPPFTVQRWFENYSPIIIIILFSQLSRNGTL